MASRGAVIATRRRVIRIRRGRITTRLRVSAINEAGMRISTLQTMISRRVARRSPTAGALWRGSGRVGTVTPCRLCALRVPRRGWERRGVVVGVAGFVVVGRGGVARLLVSTIFRAAPARGGGATLLAAGRDRGPRPG